MFPPSSPPASLSEIFDSSRSDEPGVAHDQFHAAGYSMINVYLMLLFDHEPLAPLNARHLTKMDRMCLTISCRNRLFLAISYKLP
jgi:hypothetical protein